MAKEAMKKQFDKKRSNTQGLKVGDNVWLKAKKYPLKMTFKKIGPKEIQIFWNLKKYWSKSILNRVTKRVDNLQCV